MTDLVPVLLRVAFHMRGGALYQAGETATFAPDVADWLIGRGIARPLVPDTASENPQESPMPAKALDKAPKDTMIKRAPIKKGGLQ